jgi:DnaK suppressor protein
MERYSDEDLKYFKDLLIEKRNTLIEELSFLESNALYSSQRDQGGDLSGYTNHMADSASDFTSLETNFDLAQREGKYLVYLNEALDRIDNKTYGVCVVCKKLIPKARLEAVPTTNKHVECKVAVKKVEEQEIQRSAASAASRKMPPAGE